MNLVTYDEKYRHSWMIPRNKRYIDPYNLNRELCVLQKILLSDDWIGNQENQNKFMKILKDIGLKQGGKPYDPHSGGGRTYINQLWLLGLTFQQEKKHYLTISGELIANGNPPVPILQHNLLTLQYPSPYSQSPNSKINSAIKVKPFLFILKLLFDEDIKYLSDYEILIVTIFGHNSKCYDKCKELIKELRHKAKNLFNASSTEEFFIHSIENILIKENAINYLKTKRTKNNTIKEMIKNQKDNANTFGNYLEAAQLVEASKKDKIKVIFPNFEYKKIFDDHLKKQNIFIKSNDQEQFQRMFGKYLNKKDIRTIAKIKTVVNNIQEEEVIIIQEAMPYLYDNSNLKFIPSKLIKDLKAKWGFTKNRIEKILDPILKKNWKIFERDFYDASISGKKNPIAFEKKVCKIFNSKFLFHTIHTGQKHRTSGGAYSDLLAISKDKKVCIIGEAKAIKNYPLSNSDKSIMITSYAKNYKELLDDKNIELESIVYVCGTYGNLGGIKQRCTDIFNETSRPTSMIDAKNLLKLAEIHSGKNNQSKVRNIFKSGGAIKI